MTRHQWISHLCRSVILGELAAAAVLIADDRGEPGAVVVCTVPSLLFLDAGARRAHHQARAAARRAEQAGRGEPGLQLTPCCSFWRNTDSQVHGPDCTRPPLPRRDTYRLPPADRAVFEEITARFDGRSAA